MIAGGGRSVAGKSECLHQHACLVFIVRELNISVTFPRIPNSGHKSRRRLDQDRELLVKNA